MKSRKNETPIAPFNLREQGPTAEAKLKKTVGGFRYAHGKGADRRATLDPSPCPHCKGRVEWALTYRRERGEVVPYVYARCRNAPKTHRWDFSHWVPAKAAPAPVKRTPQTAREMVTVLEESIATAPGAKTPAPRASIGNDLMTGWLDRRLEVLTVEVDRLQKIRALATEVATIEGLQLPAPRPTNGRH